MILFLFMLFKKLKLSTEQLEKLYSKRSMKTNAQKCKIISVDKDKLAVNDAIVEKVNEFTFLGSVVPESTSDNIALASSAFRRIERK